MRFDATYTNSYGFVSVIITICLVTLHFYFHPSWTIKWTVKKKIKIEWESWKTNKIINFRNENNPYDWTMSNVTHFDSIWIMFAVCMIHKQCLAVHTAYMDKCPKLSKKKLSDFVKFYSAQSSLEKKNVKFKIYYYLTFCDNQMRREQIIFFWVSKFTHWKKRSNIWKTYDLNLNMSDFSMYKIWLFRPPPSLTYRFGDKATRKR